jgi:N-acetyl-anhydromuramyl-L-alanine amidase AmpD
MLKRGDKDNEVKKLQQALIELGYSLPRWGADGDLGAESIEALARLMRAHGKKFDDDDNTVTNKELEFVFGLQNALKKPLASPVAADMFFDLRSQASREHVYAKRSWKAVTGVCLHQTACVLGERPQRWNTVGCHVGITRSGKVIWLHDFEEVVVHGHGWNAQTVGIEIDGTYAGIEGNLKTFWRPKDDPNRKPQSPTPQAIEAVKATVRWICAEVARHDGKVKVLVAHRQSSKNRQSDPGSALWQAVALPLHKELGLTDGGKGFKLGTGYPIPEAWNPAYTGVKY